MCIYEGYYKKLKVTFKNHLCACPPWHLLCMTSFLNDGHYDCTDQRGSVLALIKVTTGGLEESCISCLILITLKSAAQDRLDQSQSCWLVFGLVVLVCWVVCLKSLYTCGKQRSLCEQGCPHLIMAQALLLVPADRYPKYGPEVSIEWESWSISVILTPWE